MKRISLASSKVDEYGSRQPIALDFQPLAQFLQDEAVVAHHERTRVPLQKRAEHATRQLATSPRIRHYIQQVAGGERMVQASATRGPIGRPIGGSRCDTAVHTDLHLDVVAGSLAERKIVERCHVDLVPRRA